MSDDAFKELLRSPLEEPRKKARGDRRKARRSPGDGRDPGSWVPPLLAMVTGALIVIAGWFVANGTESTAATPTTTTTTAATTTTIPAGPESVFPATYTAIDGRLAVRAERILQRDDITYVSFSSVVAAGLEPEETSGIVGGLWELVLSDGTTVGSLEDFFDPLARGAFTVAFPAVDATSIETIRLVGNAVRLSNGFETEYTFEPGLPFATEEPTVFGLGEGLSLWIDSLELTAEGSRATWHIEGDPEVKASVSVFVETLDGSGRIPGDTLYETQATGFRRNFGTTIAPPPARRSGEIGLHAMFIGNPDSTYSATAFWTVAWFSYAGTGVDIPVEDVPVHTSGG